MSAAARNNAAWCDAVCRAHGLDPVWHASAWSSPVRTPPMYPDAVTLRPDADPRAMVAGIDLSSPGATVKDSFRTLDLTDHGFVPLLDAGWIHRGPGGITADGGVRAEIVDTDGALERWVRAWHGDDTSPPDVFRTSLLDDPDVHLFLVFGAHDGRGDDAVQGGAAVNRSGTVAGLSNVFAGGGRQDRVWAACVMAASARFPGLDLVGYESNADLEPALANGFRPIGPLRIWIHHG